MQEFDDLFGRSALGGLVAGWGGLRSISAFTPSTPYRTLCLSLQVRLNLSRNRPALRHSLRRFATKIGWREGHEEGIICVGFTFETVKQ